MNHMTVQLIWKSKRLTSTMLNYRKVKSKSKARSVGWNLKELHIVYKAASKRAMSGSGGEVMVAKSKSSKWNAQLSNNRFGMNCSPPCNQFPKDFSLLNINLSSWALSSERISSSMRSFPSRRARRSPTNAFAYMHVYNHVQFFVVGSNSDS